MVRNEMASSQAVRGARSSGRNLRALPAAPVARPRERRQAGHFTLVPSPSVRPAREASSATSEASHAEPRQPRARGDTQSIAGGAAASRHSRAVEQLLGGVF